jgi:hypothetical protein
MLTQREKAATEHSEIPGNEFLPHFAFSHVRVFVIKRRIAKARKRESAKGTTGILLCTTNNYFAGSQKLSNISSGKSHTFGPSRFRTFVFS